jgi:glucosamine-6-phosphate deaminase
MRYFVVKDMEEMGASAADMFSELIKNKPDCLLGLATGSTPLPLYAQLVKRSMAGKLDFSRVRSVNLDEYVGLGPDQVSRDRLVEI